MANFVITSVNWFHNVNLALCSNRIMPDRCLTHGCSNRSDMNAGISAHFSPTIKSERDTWLRFVHTHPGNLKVCGRCVQSISQRNVLQECFTWKAVVVGLFLAQFLQYGRSNQGNNLPNDTPPQGKPWSILSKLQCSIMSLMKFSICILYVYSQTSLLIVYIFSSNSLSLVLFISPRCCILVFDPFCLSQSCSALGR